MARRPCLFHSYCSVRAKITFTCSHRFAHTTACACAQPNAFCTKDAYACGSHGLRMRISDSSRPISSQMMMIKRSFRACLEWPPPNRTQDPEPQGGLYMKQTRNLAPTPRAHHSIALPIYATSEWERMPIVPFHFRMPHVRSRKNGRHKHAHARRVIPMRFLVRCDFSLPVLLSVDDGIRSAAETYASMAKPTLSVPSPFFAIVLHTSSMSVSRKQCTSTCERRVRKSAAAGG